MWSRKLTVRDLGMFPAHPVCLLHLLTFPSIFLSCPSVFLLSPPKDTSSVPHAWEPWSHCWETKSLEGVALQKWLHFYRHLLYAKTGQCEIQALWQAVEISGARETSWSPSSYTNRQWPDSTHSYGDKAWKKKKKCGMWILLKVNTEL